MTAYADFLRSKRLLAPADGLEIDRAELDPRLFEFQKDQVVWSLRKGRCALFNDTGLGKSFMQIEWARQLNQRAYYVLIVAPLAVAKQTVREAAKWGMSIEYVREQAAITWATPTVITNYEHIQKFDMRQFGGVVLDESSILKSQDGKTRTRLIELCREIPYRLCCTATPAPNDIAEIANHAEFLGLMTRTEMLAHFFVHDDSGWRLKGHATEPFYRWLASWGMSVKKPSDLGYEDGAFILPPLTITPHFVMTDWKPDGMLFSVKLKGIGERSQARKATVGPRVAKTVELVESEPDQRWLIFCDTNDESTALKKALNAVEVKGSDTLDHKERSLLGFANGDIPRLVSKTSIAGFGLNLQVCSRVLFCGLSDSEEKFYQGVRRVWRFGQEHPVTAHIVLSDAEYPIYENVMAKEKRAAELSANLIKNVAAYERAEISSDLGEFTYTSKTTEGDGWKMMLGDSAERIKEVPDESIDLSVFSPPFGALFVYSNTERDLGNSKNESEFFSHFSFITSELYRVMKPGRNICVHVAQLPLTKQTDGVIGIRDFRGDVIRHFVANNFVFHGEVTINKDPQAQAIRTHNKGLLFVQLKKDSSWLRPAFADYVLVFRKPGENAVPIHPDITNNDWISWAHPIWDVATTDEDRALFDSSDLFDLAPGTPLLWYGIRESDTLQGMREARDEKDGKHICPLQLGTIERCIRLWSNPGETVFSPFGGIGSEPYQALKFGRKGIAIELRPSYYEVAVKNLTQAEREAKSGSLLELMETASAD